MGEKALAGELTEDELLHVRAELEAMEAKGTLPLALKLLRKEVQAARAAAAQAGSRCGSSIRGSFRLITSSRSLLPLPRRTASEPVLTR